MSLRKKLLLLAFGMFAFATVGLVSSYKKILRWQVEKRIPGIGFDDFTIGAEGITLSRVTFDKGWIRGELTSVSADFEGKNVLVEGGAVVANLDEKHESSGEKSERNIRFQDLSVQVSHGKHSLNLEGVRSSEGGVCFFKAKMEDPPVTASEGCYDRDKKSIRLETASLKETTIHDAKLEDVSARKISLGLEDKTAQAEEIKANITFENQKLRIEANGVLANKKSEVVNFNTARIQHPWLSSNAVTFNQVAIQRGDTWKVSVGDSEIQFEQKTLKFAGRESCDTWLDSLPEELRSHPLDAIRMNGEVSFSVVFRPQPKMSLTSNCKAKCSTLPNLHKKFQYVTYAPTGEPFKKEGGRGTKEWVPLGSTGDLPIAVTTMEDPGFHHHRGFILQAFSNSFLDNVKQGKFVRGGSTITMQLAKNLWLTREKTIGRKAQEFFLAQALESCYTKDEIMELYLNVVEFGPNRYGVSSGSQHWFKKHPGDLTPTEAFWLASILPRPSKVPPPNEQSLSRIDALMKRLASDGKIPDFSLFEFDDESIDDAIEAAEPQEEKEN